VGPSANAAMRLVLYSDLLQHSNALSHYQTSYPDAPDMARTAGLRSIATRLDGVDVAIFRLERDQYSRWQTGHHFHWWKDLVRSFGGRVVYMEAI